jgi:tetratricopeptide (TPR) repeat protein
VALSELKQLLGLHPLDAQVLQLLLVAEQTNGNREQALKDLQKRFNSQQPGTRLELGLLLADAQRFKGQPQAAEQLYAQLSNESPSDIRPPLALALMKRDEGEVEAVQALLQEARRRPRSNRGWGKCRLHRPIGGEMGVKRSPSAPNKTDNSYA